MFLPLISALLFQCIFFHDGSAASYGLLMKDVGCPEPDGFFGIEGECTTYYYVCVNNVPTFVVCPGTTVFDPTTGLCQSACSITTLAPGATTAATSTTQSTPTTTTATTTAATTTPINFNCPGDGFFPIPGVCSSNYYLCFGNIPNLQTCPNGPDGKPGIFDPESLICKSQEESSCFACPEPDGYFPIPGECSNDYYICLSGTPFPEACPPNTVFDPETLLCANPETASCSKPEEFRCPELNGRFPSAPGQCNNLYYLCVDGIPYPQNCPSGAVFDPIKGTCVTTGSASC